MGQTVVVCTHRAVLEGQAALTAARNRRVALVVEMAEAGTESETAAAANNPTAVQGVEVTAETLVVGMERGENSHRVVPAATAEGAGAEVASEVVEMTARHMPQAVWVAAVEEVRSSGKHPRLLRPPDTWSIASGVCTPCRCGSIGSPRS